MSDKNGTAQKGLFETLQDKKVEQKEKHPDFPKPTFAVDENGELTINVSLVQETIKSKKGKETLFFAKLGDFVGEEIEIKFPQGDVMAKCKLSIYA